VCLDWLRGLVEQGIVEPGSGPVAIEEAELEVEKSQHLRINPIENVRRRIRIFGHWNNSDNGIVSYRLEDQLELRIDVAAAGDEHKWVMAKAGELQKFHQIVAGGVRGNPDGKASPVRPFNDKWKSEFHLLRAEK
jgi:hypothetical protein